MNLQKQTFGQTPDGQNIDLYTLTNDKGVKASIMTYGGIWINMEVPDRAGKVSEYIGSIFEQEITRIADSL